MGSTIHHYKAIIIGAGPAGVGAAVTLSNKGVDSIAIIERSDKTGGIPSLYKKKKRGVRTFIRLSKGGFPAFGSEYAGQLEKMLRKTAVQIKLQSQVISIDAEKKMITYVNPFEGKVSVTADVIILASGSREKTQAERKWISGARPAKIFFTKQLLNLVDEKELLPFSNPLIIGSDLVAYAVAAKLKNAGTSEVTIVDRNRSPKCPFPARIYFRLWGKPLYHRIDSGSINIEGKKSTSGLRTSKKTIPCDGIAICGELIPNSELALMGKLEVDTLTRIPVVNNGFEMSKPGWFAAGNVLGGFKSAEWCYLNGARVARNAFKYINR